MKRNRKQSSFRVGTELNTVASKESPFRDRYDMTDELTNYDVTLY